jgi:uncharacterized protein (DUF1501 family)
VAACTLGGFAPVLLASGRPRREASGTEPRALILIHLEGGNDGLNTFIPYGDDRYYRLRPNLAVARRDLIVLGESSGLNRAGRGLEALFKDGKLAVVQQVGYAGQSPSHFRSSEVWHTASEAEEVLYSGWVGRCVAQFQAQSRAVAVYHGSRTVPRIFVTEEDRSLAGRPVAGNWRLPLARAGELPGVQLAEVGERAAASAGTEIYFVSIPGFDTHFRQAENHPTRLEAVANALRSLQQRLECRGVAPRVLTVVFSEFGRSFAENAQGGTDHAGAGPMLLLGARVRGGFTKDGAGWPDADATPLDFRRVLATVAEQWLKVPAPAVFGRRFAPLELFI